jgi:hypothetical protein
MLGLLREPSSLASETGNDENCGWAIEGAGMLVPVHIAGLEAVAWPTH